MLFCQMVWVVSHFVSQFLTKNHLSAFGTLFAMSLVFRLRKTDNINH